ILFMAGALCGAEKLDFLRSLAVAAATAVLMIPVVAILFNALGVSDFLASYPLVGYMMVATLFRSLGLTDWYAVQTWSTLLLIGAVCLPVSLVVQTALLRTPLTRVS